MIDADKINYVNYYRRALELVSERGVILIDNVLWSGDVLKSREVDSSTAAIQELNRLIAADPQVNAVLGELIRDGIYLIRKRQAKWRLARKAIAAPPSALAYAALTTAAIVWGGSIVGQKFALGSFSAVEVSVLRGLGALALLIPLWWWQEGGKVTLSLKDLSLSSPRSASAYWATIS